VKLVFDIYDFDRDGYITPEDVRIVLSYVPITNMKDVVLGAKEGTLTSEGGGFEDFDTRIKT
jgi:Ca2+-binding EF-hand superfamily protein